MIRLIIVTYNSLSVIDSCLNKLLEKNRFMVIVDESHHFKNFLSERATALLQLAHHAKNSSITIQQIY